MKTPCRLRIFHRAVGIEHCQDFIVDIGNRQRAQYLIGIWVIISEVLNICEHIHLVERIQLAWNADGVEISQAGRYVISQLFRNQLHESWRNAKILGIGQVFCHHIGAQYRAFLAITLHAEIA